MSSNQESSASAAASSSSNANSASRSGGDKLKVQGAVTPGAAAAATLPPQRPRHHFTRSLSELSSPLRLRRQSQSQSQSPASGHNLSPSQSQIQSQSQTRRNNGVRDNRDSPDGRGPTSSQAGTASTGPTATDAAPPSNLAPVSPSHSPRLTPLSKSRTTGGLGGSPGSAAALTGNYSLAPHDGNPSSSNASSRTWSTSTTVSPNTSHQPSVHTNKDHYNRSDDYRVMQSQQPLAHDSAHHHHHHHHRHLHHSLSTSNTAGYMSSHSTTIAALAAAATAVAAASPTSQAPALPNALIHTQTNAEPEAADRSQDEVLQQQERQASSASGATLSASGLPIDPAAVRAAAAALERMQREQSRSAARVLQSAITDLDGLSNATSQRLDAAYGSVLSRLGALQDTVLALRSLAAAARATNRRFTVETESITHEISQQVQQLEGDETGGVGKDGAPVLTPADQQHRLEQLSARVHRGRQAIQDLAERVETARGRVQRWERADRAWQERTRTRLKVLWVIVSSVVLTLVVLLALMMRHSGGGAAHHDDGSSSGTVAASAASDKPNFPPGVPDLASVATPSGKFHLTFPNVTAGSSKTNKGDGAAAVGQDDDPLQRLFDEL